MSLVRVLRRYKNRLVKRFTKEIERQQLNFRCDRHITILLRSLAHQLQIPVYCLAEHSVQLGLAEVAVLMQDKELKEQLCRHLVNDHLLTLVTKPESEPESRRALRLKNALDFLRIYDNEKSLGEQRLVILKVSEEMANGEEPSEED